MARRETYKDIELSGRKWRIGKFDSLTGSYMAYLLTTKALPMGMQMLMKDNPEAQMIGSLATGGESMSKAEFISVQRDCLAVIKEITNVAGVDAEMPVLMPNGVWGVPDLEYDAVTVMFLTINVFIYNISGFFSENALKTLSEGLKALSPQNA